MLAEILVRSEENITEVVDVFWESFFDYPVMRYVLGEANPEYKSQLRTLIGFFVMARVFREEYLVGIRDGTGLVGAGIVSRPDGSPAPPEFYQFREMVWAEVGSEAEARYDEFGRACAPFEVDQPHLHLNMIGVRSSGLGQGLGRELLEFVHEMSAEDSESEGVTLTTEVEKNVALYQHFGYQLVGRGEYAPGMPTWGFYRPDNL